MNRATTPGDGLRVEGLRVEGLTVSFAGVGTVLQQVDLHVPPGTTAGLVGESGSGKSTLAAAVLGALPDGGRIDAGRVLLNGRDLGALSARARRRLWREGIKLVPQNPSASLDPSMRIGLQLAEAVDPDRPDRVAADRIDALLDRVGLPDPRRVRRAYPWQLSGGQQQRVVIAAALLGEPQLLILDEPTTSLDVTTEAAILELLRERVERRRTAVLYVSHDLGVIAKLCDAVHVLYAGDLVETAAAAAFYRRPLHPYAAGLMAALPRLDLQAGGRTAPVGMPGRIPAANERPAGCTFAPRCPLAIPACSSERPPLRLLPTADPDDGERRAACIRLEGILSGELRPTPARKPLQRHQEAGDDTVARGEGLRKSYRQSRDLLQVLTRAPRRDLHALRGVDVGIPPGSTVGMVGESGSGKSTFARALVGLEPADAGTVTLQGRTLPASVAKRDRDALAALQMVFQSSDEALNPHRSVRRTLRRPLMRLRGIGQREADAEARALLESVRLDASYLDRTPGTLSGGERQRVAIARAFATAPKAVVLDESVSGLDVSVQAAVLDTLAALQRERGSGYLFIAHDLALVATVADQVVVMYLGTVMEAGDVEAVLQPPYHPYTEALLAAAPRPDPHHRAAKPPLQGDPPDPREVGRGCPFAGRCPVEIPQVCDREAPPLRQAAGGRHRILCHHPLEHLTAEQEPLA